MQAVVNKRPQVLKLQFVTFSIEFYRLLPETLIEAAEIKFDMQTSRVYWLFSGSSEYFC
jgi:hypothetical protein